MTDSGREFHSAGDAAALRGAPVGTVYKTLVVIHAPSRARPLLVMVASGRQIDPWLLARNIGEKKLRMATQREAERLTGSRRWRSSASRSMSFSTMRLGSSNAFTAALGNEASTLSSAWRISSR